jgi:hypothetical protein
MFRALNKITISIVAGVVVVVGVVSAWLVMVDRYRNEYEIVFDPTDAKLRKFAFLKSRALEEASLHSVGVEFEEASDSILMRVNPARFAPLLAERIRDQQYGSDSNIDMRVKLLPDGVVSVQFDARKTNTGFRENLASRLRERFEAANIRLSVQDERDDGSLRVLTDMDEEDFRRVFLSVRDKLPITVYRFLMSPTEVAHAIAYGEPKGYSLVNVGSSKLLLEKASAFELGGAVGKVSGSTNVSGSTTRKIQFLDFEAVRLREFLQKFPKYSNLDVIVSCAGHPLSVGTFIDASLYIDGPCGATITGPRIIVYTNFRIRHLR